MANALFAGYKIKTLEGDATVDWEADDIDIALIDASDVAGGVVLPNTHDFYDDIVAGQVAVAELTTVAATVSGNTATVDADDAVFADVSGDEADNIVIYKNTTVDATSLLLVFFDDGGTTGLPVQPNGGSITVAFNVAGIWTW